MKRITVQIALALGGLLLSGGIVDASMNGPGRGHGDGRTSKEPVNLAQGNLFLPVTDVQIPGRGLGLELTRTYNSQVITHFPHAWDTGLGSWVVENGEASGEGGRNWHPGTWGDFELTLKMKTIAQDPEGVAPDLEFYAGWIHFRFQDYENHYQLLLKTTGVLELVKYYVENGIQERYFWRSQTALSPFNWNTFTIRMVGGQITVTANGVAIFNILDPEPLPAGRIGLEAHRSHVHWDDFTLTNLSTGQSHTHTFNDIPNQEGLFGYGWTSNLEMRIIENEPEDGMTMVIREDGRQDHFTRNPDGTYTSHPGIHDRLTKTTTGYALRRKDGLTWTFNLQGNLSSVADQNGNTLTIARDPQGRVTTVTDPTGRQLAFTYGANGKVSTVTDPFSRQWTYTYDASNHLIQVTDPLGLTERYTVDPITHNLARFTDKAGAVFQYAYTIDDRVKTQTDPEGKVTTFTWQVPFAGLGGTATTLVANAHGETWSYRFKLEDEVRPEVHDQIHVITDPYGNLEGFAWDNDKNRIGKTDESDRSVFWEYDTQGNPTKIIQFVPPAGSGSNSVSILQYEPTFSQLTALYDPNEHETHFEYDPKGNLTKLWRPFNYVEKVENAFTYDSNGQVLAATDPLGRTWRFTYDAHGNRTSATDPLENVATATYDGIGRPTSITDPNGRTAGLTWDAGSRLTKVTDPLGGETIYTYDGNDNVLTATDPEGRTTTFTYDGLGNLTKVADPLGNATAYTWDTADFMHFGTSRLMSMTDGNGKTTTYAYDKRGRLISVTDSKGSVTRYGYDQTSHVTSITDANRRTTAFVYDDLERLTKTTDPLGNVTTFAYDRLGHLTAKTDAEGQTTTYTYDELDRLTRISYPDGSTATYTYDKAGNRTRMADSTGVTTYTHDALSRPTGVTTPDNRTITYTYDRVGNRTGMTSPIGLTSYTYDALNRLTRLTDPLGGAYDFGYDRASRRTSLRFPNGLTTSYTYDPASRLTHLRSTNSSLQTLLELAYAYDPAGNVLGITRSPSGSSGAGASTYTYDTLNQLTQAIYPGGISEAFTYDPVGNRLTASGVPHAYDAANRLLRAGPVTYAYDRIGNRIAQHDPAGGSKTFTYDGANRLVAVDPASVVTQTLSPGWNFIASPFLGASVDVKSALSPLSLNTDYDQVSRYKAPSGPFEHFVGIDRYNQFSTLDPTKGYELYVTNPNGATLNLTSASPSRTQSVPLDSGWNLVGSPRPQTLPVADALAPLVQGLDYDQVLQLNPTTGSYDPATSLAPGTAYWLRTLRATNLTIPAPATHAITYAYDGNGTRIAKAVNGVITRYLHDGLDALAEFNQAGTLTTSYVHGAGVDELLAIRNHTTGTTFYPLTDHLGSLVALTDSAGVVQATFTYAAFGSIRTKTGSADTRFRFTGRELDTESGLYHYRARAYDSAVGRFLQPDPWPRTPADPRLTGMNYLSRLAAVGHPLPGAIPGSLAVNLPMVAITLQANLLQNPLGLSAYPYVLNNPLRWTDPLGLEGGKNTLIQNVVINVGRALGNQYGQSIGGRVGGIIGAVIGSVVGGPAGAQGGFIIGTGVGTAYGGVIGSGLGAAAGEAVSGGSAGG